MLKLVSMKLTILGTRGEIEESSRSHKKHSGCLVDLGSKKVLIDLGEEEYLDLKPDVLIITHAHPDHLNIEDKNKLYTLELRVVCCKDSYETVSKVLDPAKVEAKDRIVVDGHVFRLIPVVHSPLYPACLVVIDDKVVYATDFVWVNKKYHKYLKNAEIWIGDGSSLTRDLIRKWKKDPKVILGHSSVKKQIDLAKRLGVKKFIVAHVGKEIIDLGDRETEKRLKDLAGEDIEVYLAKDGMTIESLALMPSDVAPITPKVIATANYALYLVPPHGELIYRGDKTLIIKSRKFTEHIDEDLLLISDSLCYGVIKLKDPKEISIDEFWDLKDRHKITREEFKEWNWDTRDRLYAYEFTFTPFSVPKIVEVPRGVQTFVRVDLLKFKSPRDLSDSEVEYLHAVAHSTNNFFLHLLLLERLPYHLERDDLDRRVALIPDIRKYDPSKMEDRVLGDDWRIVLAWYSTLKRTKKPFTTPQFKDLSYEDQLKVCLEVGEKIAREMIKRGFSFNRPETYKKYARELFEKIIDRIGRDKFKWKEGLKLPRPLDQIDVPYVTSLDDQSLLDLYRAIHEEFKKIGKVTEDLYNANIIVGTELYKRGLYVKNKIQDELTRITDLEIQEYPTPKGIQLSEEITLEEVIRELPDHIIVRGQPYAGYLTGRVANLGVSPKGHDVDLLLRQHPDPRLIRAIKESLPRRLKNRLHPFFDPFGPYIGLSVPVYQYGLIKIPKSEMIRGFGPFRSSYSGLESLSIEFLAEAIKLEIGKPFIGLKPKGGLGKLEFFEVEEMWIKFGSKYIDRGILVQEKVDGRRHQFHIDLEKDKVYIFTEDRQRERSKVFPEIVEELKRLKIKNAILDGEMLVFEFPSKIIPKNARAKREVGDLVPREDTAVITTGKTIPEDFRKRIVVVFYDIVYLDDEVLAHLGAKERLEILKKVVPKNLQYLDVIRGDEAKSMRSFFELVDKYRKVNGSEGVVCKVSDSPYPIKYSGENRTDLWCKLKNLKEIDVMVWNVVQKKTKEGKPLDQYMYDCVFLVDKKSAMKIDPDHLVEYKGKLYSLIGRTYATAIKCKRGDIITVAPVRIRWYSEDTKGHYTWMFPVFIEKRTDKKDPDTITTVERIAKVGTAPLSILEELSEVVTINLELCPFWRDLSICPLRKIFGRRRASLVPKEEELSIVRIQYLRFPVLCPLAYIYRCQYLKDYYYSYRVYKREPIS